MRLPFNIHTIANTYQPEAFISGIVFSQSQKHMPYFLSNYIRTVYYVKNEGTILNYYMDNPLLINDGLISSDYAVIPQLCVKDLDISKIAKCSLDNKKYVFGVFNDEYIPEKSSYQRFYFQHDYLLYGYDENGFISAAYLRDGFFKEFHISFEDYNLAVRTLGSDQYIRFLTYDAESDLCFIPKMVKNALSDYLHSRNLKQDKTIYELMRLNSLLMSLTSSMIDIRSVCFLKEHKNLMKMRLEYMHNHEHIEFDAKILSDYADMVKELQKAILLAMKYNMTHKYHITQSLKDIIGKSIVQDEKVLSDIYKCL